MTGGVQVAPLVTAHGGNHEAPLGITLLLVRKEGYPVAGPTAPTVTGDTRFDIELVRR
jgi:hypothetical protein